MKFGPGRVFLVSVPRREYGPPSRSRRRWIVDDFRLGEYRRRGDAVRAARAAGMGWVR